MSGHFGCCDFGGSATVLNCICGCCCPQCTIAWGQLNSYDRCNGMDSLPDYCFMMFCGLSVGGYSLFRKGYNIEGNSLVDCLYVLFCSYCRLPVCQMANESEQRGPRPYKHPLRHEMPQKWENDFWSGCSDFLHWLFGCCCCPCAFGLVAEKFMEFPWFYACCCLPPAHLRFDMRHQLNIEGNCCLDCLSVAFCPGCAYVQMKREAEQKACSPAKTMTEDGEYQPLSKFPNKDDPPQQQPQAPYQQQPPQYQQQPPQYPPPQQGGNAYGAVNAPQQYPPPTQQGVPPQYPPPSQQGVPPQYPPPAQQGVPPPAGGGETTPLL